MKTVLITGGTSGIGKAAAQYFKREGNQVIITGQDQRRLNSTAEELGVEPILCDSSQIDHIKAMPAQLKSEGIFLDTLILNAGVFVPAPAMSETAESIDRTMSVNFVGPLLTVNALLPVLNHPASIVYISSIAVNTAARNCAVYSASKAAFEAAARVMNLELAGQGIRFNHIRPGITRTEIQLKTGMSEGQVNELAETLTGTPLGRMLSPEDIVPAIALLSSEQSIGMHSSTITIDGGYALR
jgi:NAD(P)-dependent dehydrogenase (short-subunit alcohol dehydrogenase family)